MPVWRCQRRCGSGAGKTGWGRSRRRGASHNRRHSGEIEAVARKGNRRWLGKACARLPTCPCAGVSPSHYPANNWHVDCPARPLRAPPVPAESTLDLTGVRSDRNMTGLSAVRAVCAVCAVRGPGPGARDTTREASPRRSVPGPVRFDWSDNRLALCLRHPDLPVPLPRQRTGGAED